MTCKDGIHPGLNNTTGKCIACGEFIDESPFKQAITLDQSKLYSIVREQTSFSQQEQIKIISALNNFFSQNVCIPKGETLQFYDEIGCAWLDKTSIHHNTKYRTKPSEPVYEWQWYRKVDGKVIDWSEAFRTEQENQDRWSKPDEWYKFEETKRARQ